MKARYQCQKCGKVTAGRKPVLAWNKGEYVPSLGKISYRYNTDVMYPRKHRINGVLCKGSYWEAIEITDNH